MTSTLRDQLQHTLRGAYTIERELGGGGMSRVFLAEEMAFGRRVVIKVLPPEVAADVNADRFKREIQVAARLQHPHIVPVLSTGEMDGIPYYTMPFIEGESVRSRLSRTGALAITEAIGVLRDVGRALAYAHEHGIVHRDIKPDNVLLSGGSATVTDFGIAKAIAAARGDGDSAVATLTQVGSSLGTPAYMAPEQAAADPATNHRADIYAFGCMAYEILTGRPPFIEKSPQRLLAAQMSDTPEPVKSLRMDVPDSLAELVMRCLEKEPDRRPQQARDLVHVLDTVTSGGGYAPMPAVLLGGKGMVRKALLAYAAAFVFVAVLAKAAIVAVGLPDWVYPGALVVMALGLPVILFTAYVHHTTRRLVTQTPTYTPGGTPSMQGPMATLAMKASPHVSWRRAWLGGVFAVGAFVVLIAAYMATRALGVGPFGSLLAAGTFQQNEKLLVADFTATAADTSIAPVVTDAFRTALSQSRSIGVLQPSTVREVLRRMQRPAGTTIDFAVAREVATREGLRAVILGNVIQLGGKYAISVRLLSPQTGDELANFRETANGDAELLPAVDKLAKDLRARIGESLRSVQTTPPLERVTTPSLEALKKYVQGNRVMSYEGDFAKGAALLEEAIALDSGFAMAYRRLAVEYSNRQQHDRSLELLEKAYRHQDRLSDAERYLLLGTYYFRGPRQDLSKSTAAYESLLELQPDFVTALNNVAINYRWERNWPKAEESLRRALALRAPIVTYNQMAWTLWNQGRHDDAWRFLAQYDSAYPETPDPMMRRAQLLSASLQLDSAVALARAALAVRPGDLPLRASVRSFTAMVNRTAGRLREATRLDAEEAVLDRQRGIVHSDLEQALDAAMPQLLYLSDSAGALARVDRALAGTPLENIPAISRPYAQLALLYGLGGREGHARRLLASFDQSRQTVQRYQDASDRPFIMGAIALAGRRYAAAAGEFRRADVGDWPSGTAPLLAMSLDLAGQRDSALTEYERYLGLDDPFRVFADQYLLAGALLRAGELYEEKGDLPRALAHYTRFVELWKSADPELQPKVADVRSRVARLRAAERAKQ